MRPSITRNLPTIFWGLSVAGLGVLGWWVLTACFMPYDDEGYVQWALKEVSHGHALYTEVFSQYGPFFHAIHLLLGKLGYPFTSDAARIVALVYWLATALGAGLLTHRLTRNTWLGWMGLVLTFLALTRMRFEPGHPGGFLAVLSAWGAYLGVHWIERDDPRSFGRWQAAISACMFWTKINVGTLHLIAATTWWPFRAPTSVGDNTRRLLRLALVVIAGGTLVAGLIQHREVQVFLLFFVCAGGALAWTWPDSPPYAHDKVWQSLGNAAAIFILVTLAACIPAMIGGTSMNDLVRGAILDPIKHPAVYHYFVPWRSADLFVIGLSAVGLGVYKLGPAGLRTAVLRVLKIVALALLAEVALRAHFGAIERATFLRFPLLAWALATPLDEETPASLRQARHWLAWLLCWSWLQAFPVAGTQYVWGSILAVPLALAGTWDLARLRGRRWFLIAGCGLSAWAVGQVTSHALTSRALTEPLGLSGARHVRLFADNASTYRLLVKNAQSCGDVLFTFPGMLSLNQWSGLPAPTHANTTHWFSLLDDTRQLEVIRALRAADHPVIIISRSQIHYLIEQGLPPRGLLKEFVFREFEPGLRVREFDVWKPRGSVFTPVSCARLVNDVDASPQAMLVLLTTAEKATRLEVIALGQNKVLAAIGRDDHWQTTRLPARLQPPYEHAEVRRLTMPVSIDTAALVARPDVEFVLRDQQGLALDRLRLDRAPFPAEAFNVLSSRSTN